MRETVTQIGRDSFARTTLMRFTVPKTERRDCEWCGGPAKFRYWIEADSSKYRMIADHSHRQFCSVSCYRTYHNG